MKLLLQVILVWICSSVARAKYVDTGPLEEGGEDTLEIFIADIITTWKLRSPTIILMEEIPHLCMRHEMILCISNNGNIEEMAEHLAAIHGGRNQDGLVFIGSQIHEQLIRKITKDEPSTFISNCPIIMPKEYSNSLNLRLDSNVIFYEEITQMEYKLHDVFAVKGGPKITLELAQWNYYSGILMKNTINRWDRRTDLKGATFVNGLSARKLVKNTNGDIVGGKFYFQDQLRYITNRLNLTIRTVQTPKEMGKSLKNGSWTYSLGMLQQNEMDVLSYGLGLNVERYSVVDYPSPAYRVPRIFIAKIPTGTAPNMWVYIEVFGMYQWSIYLALLLLLAIALYLINALGQEESGNSFRIKRGNQSKYKLDSSVSCIALVYLYSIQMGSHSTTKKTPTRLLTLTLAFLTLLMFIYYTSNVTAEMTFGAPKIPVRNFDDVIHHGYKVVTTSSFLRDSLAAEEPGSAKYKVYKAFVEPEENLPLPKMAEAFSKVVTEEKTLYYNCKCAMASKQGKKYHGQIVALPVDDGSYALSTFALAKGSEFLQIFNHYLLKAEENGIIKRIYREHHMIFFINEQFGMMEAQPLGNKNVMFAFICLAFGICVSLVMAFVEWLWIYEEKAFRE